MMPPARPRSGRRSWRSAGHDDRVVDGPSALIPEVVDRSIADAVIAWWQIRSVIHVLDGGPARRAFGVTPVVDACRGASGRLAHVELDPPVAGPGAIGRPTGSDAE